MEGSMLDKFDRERFELIRRGSNYPCIEDTLRELSKHLADYYHQDCIVLIDEYDHPMDIAYRYGYYEKARNLFAGLMGKLLKVSITFECYLKIPTTHLTCGSIIGQ